MRAGSAVVAAVTDVTTIAASAPTARSIRVIDSPFVR
jgi:hypothetical protein